MAGQRYGFKGYLDVLGEGGSRHVELIGGRSFEAALQLAPVTGSAKVIKFPLTGHQKARLFASARKPRVSIEH